MSEPRVNRGKYVASGYHGTGAQNSKAAGLGRNPTNARFLAQGWFKQRRAVLIHFDKDIHKAARFRLQIKRLWRE